MKDNKVKKTIANIFNEMATGLETGSFGAKPKIALVGLGSELGEDNMLAAAKLAAQDNVEVLFLGQKEAEGITTIKCDSEDEVFKKMEELIDSGEADAAVALHYPFPIGISTVGRAVAPSSGKKFYLSTTTGTSSTDRVEALVLNAINGVATAKASGVKDPTVGLLNVDGARQAESILNKLIENGYDLKLAASARADGGAVMRGNDVLLGTPDIMVQDSLTGNVLTKMMSAFTSGGKMEAIGDGYGPGMGQGAKRLVLIVSRASGPAVIAGAIRYAAQLVKGKALDILHKEYEEAKKCGLKELLAERKKSQSKEVEQAPVKAPDKEVVTHEIAGIEVTDLDDAVEVLWRENIYAESGMGCTGHSRTTA